MRSRTLDVAVPIYGLDQPQIVSLLDSIRDNTQVTYRLLILSDNAGAEATQVMRAWVGDNKVDASLLRNGVRRYFAAAVNQLVPYSKAEYLAVVHPATTIRDKSWVSRMTMCFRDSQAYLCGVNAFDAPTYGHPVQLNKKSGPVSNALMVFRRPFLPLLDESSSTEPMRKTQAQILARGQRVYVCPSVRFSVRRFESAQKAPLTPGTKASSPPEVLIG